MKRRALFVGIDKYTRGIPELSCARNDANALLEYFMKHGYAEDEVSILRDGRTSEILDELDEQTKRLKPGDLFLFFFAGHGYTIEKSDGTFDRCLAGADDRRERILRGKEGISLSEIRDRADKAKCSFVVILDACQTKIGSSRAVNINGKDVCNKRDLLAISSVVNRKRNNGPSAPFLVINSCDVGEVAYELEDIEQGLFTFSMLEIFKQMDRNGEIPVFDSRLINQIEGWMNSHENGYVQHPKLIIPDSCDYSGICIFPVDFRKGGREELSCLHQNHLGSPQHYPAVEPTSSSTPPPQSVVSAPSLVKCPVCGRWRNKTETFDCRECGRENLCIGHQDPKTFLCTDCMAKKVLPKMGDVKAQVECERKVSEETEVNTYRETHKRVQLWAGGPYWATTNIGAENPWDYGWYFWWGDTIGYKRENNVWVASDDSSLNFSFSRGNTRTFGKSLDTLRSKGWVTLDHILKLEHDSAHAQWGGK